MSAQNHPANDARSPSVQQPILTPEPVQAPEEYRTAAGCLMLGGLTLLMIAGLVVLILVVGEPMQ